MNTKCLFSHALHMYLLNCHERASCSTGNGGDGSVQCRVEHMSPICCHPCNSQLQPDQALSFPRHWGPSSSTSPRTLTNWWWMPGISSTSTQRSSPMSAKAGSSGPRTGPAAGVFFPKTTQREPMSQTHGLSTGWLWSSPQVLGLCGCFLLYATGSPPCCQLWAARRELEVGWDGDSRGGLQGLVGKIRLLNGKG